MSINIEARRACDNARNKIPEVRKRKTEVMKFKVAEGKTYKIETLQTEIIKCDLVCSNCHRIRTFERRAA